MTKQIPCFICGMAVELHDKTAIAALCTDHWTKENIEKLKNMPTHQLLRVLNDGVKQELEINKTDTANQILALKNQIAQLETQLKNQETIVQEVQEIPKSQETTQGNVNEWGEVI